MLASHDLFETVLKKLVGDMKVELEQEVGRRPEDFADAEQTGTIRGIFDSFPRRLSRYCSIVSTLANLAEYAVTDVLKFLTHACAIVYSGKKCSTFAELTGIEFDEPMLSSRMKGQYVRFFELIFISDLVCTIIAKHGVCDKPGFLIKCGLLICSSQPSDEGTTHLVLDQWSVVFSMISLAKPAMLFEMLTRFIINKPDMFFVIMKFVRLDAPDCPADDLVDVMAMYIKRAKQRRIVSSVMLSAMSTFLMTYPGKPERLTEFMDVGLEFCKNPNTKPGAVDLVVSLIPKMDWSKEKAAEFYQQVFPMAETAEGIKTAAKALRLLMCGKDLRAEWLFWVWGPEARSNELQFLEWSGEEDYISIFVKYFLHSKHYKVCPNLLKDIIVHLASLNFDQFSEQLLPAFLEDIGKDTDRFMCFISIVPVINDPKFLKIARTKNLTVEKIQRFNEKLASTAAAVLAKETRAINKFGLTPDQYELHRQAISYATNEVESMLENWKIDMGIPLVNVVNRGAGPRASPSSQSLKIVKIMPFLLNSELFQRLELTQSVITLAASADTSMSHPAYRLAQANMKRPEHRKQIMQQLVDMVSVSQMQAVALVCLRLLVEGLDDMEPRSQDNEDEFEYAIEFAGFLALTNEHPLIRIVGFDLLQKANKLLKNRGFYAQIEENIQAIESNVKHNMIMQKLPKHPGRYGFYDGQLHLSSAVKSLYQIPWLYFLAELGHIILTSNYRPILKRIIAMAVEFANNPYMFGESKSFRQGVFVVFCSTCYIEKCVGDGIPGYTNKMGLSEERLGSYSDILKTIILREYASEEMTVALRHVHYSLVGMVIDCYPFKDTNFESNLVLLFYLLKALEGNKQLLREIFIPVLQIIWPMLDKFSRLGLNVKDKQFCPKQSFQPLLNSFDKNERLILLFLSVILMWLEKRGKTDQILSPGIVFFVLNWACMSDKSSDKVCERIQTYARAALVPLFSCGVKINNGEQNQKILAACARIEARGFKVLQPMLQNNRQELLEESLMMCVTQKSTISDLFFDAIYELLPDMESGVQPTDVKTDGMFSMSLVGKVFLVGLVGLKTGSVSAKQFLMKFIPCYAAQINYKEKEQLDVDLRDKDISDVLAKHFVRVSEFVVAAAMECLKDPEFKGTFRVIVDTIIPWVKQFRMLPKQEMCMPSAKSTGSGLPARQFLGDLMEITAAKVNSHDFERVVDMWAILLEVKDQQDLVLGFITNDVSRPLDTASEKTRTEVNVSLFVHLLDRLPELIIKRMVRRCDFAFYAYITYEMKTRFDNEFWMIPILTRAINRYKEISMQYICSIVQFALLFHDNQTQTLLKRVSKLLPVPYRRSTLSSGTIQRIVGVFQKRIVESNTDDQLKSINKWALEAMKWVIGTPVLKIAHTSLIIVNNLNYTIDDTDITQFLQGICKSTAFFMKQSSSGNQLTYEFINATFKAFERHFINHEQMCLDYINSFIKFVVSVDAYFPNMLVLYRRCLESSVTKAQALDSILDALQPSLNELESDSKARDAFDIFVANYDTLDLRLVRQVLTRSNDSDIDIVNSAPLNELNRALGHFSLMVDTASLDLKKRVFKISTLIVKKFTEVREISQSVQSSPVKPRMAPREMRTLSPTTQSTKGDEVTEENEEEEAKVPDQELDKQALVAIFWAAIPLLPGSREALDFVVAIAYNDPLIPTIPRMDENWDEAVETAVEKLHAIARPEKDVVSLTDCATLKVASSLLGQDQRPQILPFTLQANVMPNLTKREKRVVVNARLDTLMRKVSSVALELHRRVADRISPQIKVVRGVYQPLQLPTQLVGDEKLKGNGPKTEGQVIISDEEFLKLEMEDQ